LAHAGFDVTGVELNQAFLDYARSREDIAVTWVCADLMEFQSERLFDVAVMGELVEHSGVPERLVTAAMRLIRPGGLLVLTTPNGKRLRQPLPTFFDGRRLTPTARHGFFWGPAASTMNISSRVRNWRPYSVPDSSGSSFNRSGVLCSTESPSGS